MPKVWENWDDSRGDMFYGIGPEISKYIIRVCGLTGTPRQMRDEAHRRKEEEFAAINTYNTAIKSDTFGLSHNSLTVQPLSSTNARITQYINALQLHAKYGPQSVSGPVSGLLPALTKGRDTLTGASKARDLRGGAKELAIRRSCKFGIEYNLKHLASAQVHYILDSMDMAVVAKKTWMDKRIDLQSGVTLQFKKISICTSELRFLFRNWQWISATNRVKFYYGFDEVPAPWVDDKYSHTFADWADYAAHRVEGVLKKNLQVVISQSRDLGGIYYQKYLSDLIQSFVQARAASKPAKEQIAIFHSIPSQLVNSWD